MIKNINNKGFTLIELLATIAILGLITTITVTSITAFYENSKIKSEEAFIKQLKNVVDDYITLEGSKLNYSSTGETKQKCYMDGNTEKCDNVVLYTSTNTPGFDVIIDTINNGDMINPSSEIKCNSSNTLVNIYRDTDFVYCLKISPKLATGNCFDEVIDSCAGIYK